MERDETRVWSSSNRIFVSVCRKWWKKKIFKTPFHGAAAGGGAGGEQLQCKKTVSTQKNSKFCLKGHRFRVISEYRIIRTVSSKSLEGMLQSENFIVWTNITQKQTVSVLLVCLVMCVLKDEPPKPRQLEEWMNWAAFPYANCSVLTSFFGHIYINVNFRNKLPGCTNFRANPPSSYNHCYFNNCIHFKETQVMQLPAKALKLTKPLGYQHF